MVAALPVEIVDLILRISLQQSSLSVDEPSQQVRAWPISDAASPWPLLSSHKADPPIDAAQAAIVSVLSRHHRDSFQHHLYRHVALFNHRCLELFARTITSRPDLSTRVRSLFILCNDRHAASPQDIGRDAQSGLDSDPAHRTVADVILSACPDVTHLLLSCNQFARLSTGLYNLRRPKDVTLVNVTRIDDLFGIVTRHRDLTAASLQNDPRIQAILRGGPTQAHQEQPAELVDPTRSPSTSPQLALAARAERSLSHLHLVNFDTRLLHRLVTLSSLTHLVLTHPAVPDRRPGAPGLSVIPRSHLMLLLGSGNISRIIIRADLATCIRIMEEIAPIQDRKLVFRPLGSGVDPCSWPSSQTSSRIARLGSDVAALYESIVASEVDFLAEFYHRLRPSARRRQAQFSTSSAEDGDTSRDSSGLASHGRSSDSSAGGSSGSSGVATSQSVSAGSGDDDQPAINSTEDYGSDDQEALDDDEDDVPPVPARVLNTNAPPLNIPIEELLRSERFNPAGHVAPTTCSSGASSGTEHTGNASRSTHPSRQRQRFAPQSAFALRRTDLRGATHHNILLCTRLSEALAAISGTDAAAHSEINFW